MEVSPLEFSNGVDYNWELPLSLVLGMATTSLRIPTLSAVIQTLLRKSSDAFECGGVRAPKDPPR